ncbi:hypothetical protein [Nostoc sphaeroides]|uniref:hypothetical protein n=1 Tax=Nostoc sphaeroides TaxID=446679 RepID=UPI0015F301E8|nr:hypothetical protein [Nostoc sphaeroides]
MNNRRIASQENKTAWVQNLIKQTALIWGNQGGGKSWLARYVALKKKEAGYKVIVLDPDSNRAEWKGLESYHSWSDIEAQIRAYVEEIESRLFTFNNSNLSEDQWRQKLWADGKATALICEEVTTYSDFIKDEELLSKFGKLALTKSRKQEMPITVVAHNNTQTCLFGIKGLHNLVSKMLQVECLAEVDPVTLQPKSTGKAKVKLDSSNEWIDVNLPIMTTKITDFGTNNRPVTPQERESLEELYRRLEFPEPSEPQTEPLNQPQSNDSEENEQRFYTPLKLTRDQCLMLIKQLRTELNQTEIIEKLWQCKKGGSAAWKEAYAQFKEVTDGQI